jgi:hypothetical protein
MGLELHLRETIKSLRSPGAGSDSCVEPGSRRGIRGPAYERPSDGGALCHGAPHFQPGPGPRQP